MSSAARGAAKPSAAFAVLFTGLPASGKSTLAAALGASLAPRDVRMLDGDQLRQMSGHPVGYSRADRDASVQRAAMLARDSIAEGVIAICALIAPYEAARTEMRRTIEPAGGFVEIYVATPLDVCQRRDPKGHYAKAAAGELPQFTGVSDPYEVPKSPDLTIDTSTVPLERAIADITAYLTVRGYGGAESRRL